MSHYSVTVDGHKTEYTGTDSFFQSARDANRAEKPNSDGLCEHSVVWRNETENKILTSGSPGQRTGCSR